MISIKIVPLISDLGKTPLSVPSIFKGVLALVLTDPNKKAKITNTVTNKKTRHLGILPYKKTLF